MRMSDFLAREHPFMASGRGELLNWRADPLLQIGINLGRVLEKLGLLFHGGYTWVFSGLALCALAGAVRFGQRRGRSGKSGLLFLLALPLLVLLVPGITLLFRDFNGKRPSPLARSTA